MKLLVCGGRNYQDYATLSKVLNGLHKEYGFTTVIHGAAKGADSLADRWAKQHDIPVQAFPAQWRTHEENCSPNCRSNSYCRRAGFRRNEQMLLEGKPEMVVGFPGGAGTAGMLKLSRDAGVTTKRVAAPAERPAR